MGCSQRDQENGPDSFDVLISYDIDIVNTFLSTFLANGKLSWACSMFEIFSDPDVDPVSYNSMISSFVRKGYFNETWGYPSPKGLLYLMLIFCFGRWVSVRWAEEEEGLMLSPLLTSGG